MVESKSLKLYLFSFRNHGDFHEDCVNVIMKDLIRLMDPKYIEVWGKFTPRGRIAIMESLEHAGRQLHGKDCHSTICIRKRWTTADLDKSKGQPSPGWLWFFNLRTMLSAALPFACCDRNKKM